MHFLLDFLLVYSCMKKNVFSPTQEQGFYLQLDFLLVSSCMKKEEEMFSPIQEQEFYL